VRAQSQDHISKSWPCSPPLTSNRAASAPVGRWALKACRQIKVALGAITMVPDATPLNPVLADVGKADWHPDPAS